MSHGGPLCCAPLGLLLTFRAYWSDWERRAQHLFGPGAALLWPRAVSPLLPPRSGATTQLGSNPSWGKVLGSRQAA